MKKFIIFGIIAILLKVMKKIFIFFLIFPTLTRAVITQDQTAVVGTVPVATAPVVQAPVDTIPVTGTAPVAGYAQGVTGPIPVPAAPVITTVPAAGAAIVPAGVAPAVAIAPAILYQRELEQINYEVAQFWNRNARFGGRISPRTWDNFARGLVTRHPNVLELRCDKATTGNVYLQYNNPNYLFLTNVAPYCRIYVKPYVNAPIVPKASTAAPYP